MKRFNFEDIQGRPISYDPFESNTRRLSALEIVKEHKRTYILGKPGAGKTTFLKSLVIAACRGSDLPPLNGTILNLVKSVFGKENRLEEAIYRRADYWISGLLPVPWTLP